MEGYCCFLDPEHVIVVQVAVPLLELDLQLVLVGHVVPSLVDQLVVLL